MSSRKDQEELNPKSFLDLLKISLRLTEQESKEWQSTAEPMDEERRKWLANVMDSMSQNDDISRLKETTRILQEVPPNEVEGEDMIQARVNALEEIQFLVEITDNAKDLHLIGGLKTVVQTLCSPHSVLRWRAAEVIANSVQNNPFCQTACIQLAALPILLLLITSDEVDVVRVKALYALSGLIKHSPVAESDFLRHRGYEALHVAIKSNVLKLQIKAVFLIRALINQDDVTQGNRILELFINDGLIATLLRRLKDKRDDAHEHVAGLFSDLLDRCSTSVLGCVGVDSDILHALQDRKKELETEDADQYQEEINSIANILEKLKSVSV